MEKYYLKLCLIAGLIIQSYLSFAQDISLWNGETSTINTCGFSYGIADNSSPYNGQWAYKAEIGKWTHGIINLKCQNTWRIDLSGSTEIHFYIKSNNPNPNIKFGLTGWPYISNMIDISPYIENGPISSQYKLVKIPTQLLKTPDFTLHAVETMRFETTDVSAEFYADDFKAVDLVPNKVESITLLSNQVIRLNIDGKYDMADVQNLINYEITSLDDPDFIQAKNPNQVGRHFFVKEFKENTFSPIIKNEVFLVFQKPFKNGKKYNINIKNIKDLSGNNFSAPQLFTFVFNDEQLVGSSVKVNQVGYLTWGPKYGYIGNYIGDAGVMPLFPTAFEIRSEGTNQVVLSGIPEFRGSDLAMSGEKVFECDFSSLNTPGKYYLYVPGMGKSFVFELSDHAMDSVYYKTARAMFYQRCGMAINPPFTDAKWAHGICHAHDGISHDSWEKSSLYDKETINKSYRMPMGWHDAGDYGKYTMTGCTALYYLFSIYQFYPEKFADSELNIPESGNGVPDILDEAKHEIMWLLKMQAPDGGVYERVTTLKWPTTMPENDFENRYISEKTTHTTAQFSAIMAMAYRNFLPFWPDLAKRCLAKSKLAMGFLLKHPNTIPINGYDPELVGMGGGYYMDHLGDTDERAWAAAEIYKSTGDIYFRNLFDSFWIKNPPDWGWNPFQHHQINASLAYASTSFPVDQAKVNQIKTAFIEKAESILIYRTDNNIYRTAARANIPDFIGWGTYGQSSKYSWDLIMAYYLSGNEKFKKYALINLDVQLGNNPQSRTYITGVGSNAPMHPLHHPSLHDEVVEPVPGIPVFGPSAHLNESNNYNVLVQSTQNLYPSGDHENAPYPVLRRYYDISSNVAMSEFNIIDEAITSSVFGFFKSTPLQSASYPQSETKINYFNAILNQPEVSLSWETNTEYQLDYFEIERSKDGKTFESIIKKISLDNSEVSRKYEHKDQQPLTGFSYYRLKTVDLCENVFYSTLIPIQNKTNSPNQINLYPNPVIDHVNLEYLAGTTDSKVWNMAVTQFDGNLSFKSEGTLGFLTDLLNQYLYRMKPGVYLIYIKSKEEEYTIKFIKN